MTPVGTAIRVATLAVLAASAAIDAAARDDARTARSAGGLWISIWIGCAVARCACGRTRRGGSRPFTPRARSRRDGSLPWSLPGGLGARVERAGAAKARRQRARRAARWYARWRCAAAVAVGARPGGRWRCARGSPGGNWRGYVNVNQIDGESRTWHGKQKLIRDRDTEQHGMIDDSINLTWDCRTVAHGTPDRHTGHISHHGTNGLRRSGVDSKQRRGEGGHSRCRPRAAPTTTP
jgi:hypothetical protein